MNYYITFLSLWYQGKKCSVKFRDSTRSASKKSSKIGERSVLTIGSLSFPYPFPAYPAICDTA